jgi:hypothetical protein
MENVSPKSNVTLLIVPGILVVELGSAQPRPDVVPSPTLETVAPLELASKVVFPDRFAAEDAGWSKSDEATLENGEASLT